MLLKAHSPGSLVDTIKMDYKVFYENSQNLFRECTLELELKSRYFLLKIEQPLEHKFQGKSNNIKLIFR